MHEKCGCVDYKMKYDKTQRVCNTSHHQVGKELLHLTIFLHSKNLFVFFFLLTPVFRRSVIYLANLPASFNIQLVLLVSPNWSSFMHRCLKKCFLYHTCMLIPNPTLVAATCLWAHVHAHCSDGLPLLFTVRRSLVLSSIQRSKVMPWDWNCSPSLLCAHWQDSQKLDLGNCWLKKFTW